MGLDGEREKRSGIQRTAAIFAFARSSGLGCEIAREWVGAICLILTQHNAPGHKQENGDGC